MPAEAATWIATYAAALSTLLAIGKLWSWLDSRRTKVKLTVADWVAEFADGAPVAGVTVRIHNGSHHAVHPIAAGAKALMPNGKYNMCAVRDGRVPESVPARETLSFNLAADELPHGCSGRPLSVWIRLTDGTVVEGWKPTG